MGSVRMGAIAAVMALGACAGPARPTYDFEAGYAPSVATPSGIDRDLRAYAAQICGADDHEILDQLFVGDYGPDYVRIRFACS